MLLLYYLWWWLSINIFFVICFYLATPINQYHWLFWNITICWCGNQSWSLLWCFQCQVLLFPFCPTFVLFVMMVWHCIYNYFHCKFLLPGNINESISFIVLNHNYLLPWEPTLVFTMVCSMPLVQPLPLPSFPGLHDLFETFVMLYSDIILWTTF